MTWFLEIFSITFFPLFLHAGVEVLIEIEILPKYFSEQLGIG